MFDDRRPAPPVSLPWVLAPGFRDDPRFTAATPDRRRLAEQFRQDGVAVVRGLVPDDVVALARRSAEAEFGRLGAVAGPKIEGAWRTSPALRSLAVLEPIVELVEWLHGRGAIPFQTLTFRAGSEQAVHADSVHFDSIPSGWMCGVWVALEDVGPHQGPLRYVAGSHADLPARSAEAALSGRVAYDEYEERVAESVAASGGAVSFEASAGDVLVWAAHVLHGGAPVLDPTSTRWSQVTHYFFDGHVYVTPRAADPGRVRVREEMTDLRTGRRVRHTLPAGSTLVRDRGGQSRLLAAGDAAPSVGERGASVARGALAASRWRVRRALDGRRRR